MKNILFYIMTSACLLAPYKYLEQDNVNSVILAIIAVFSIFYIKTLKGNKKYSICLLIMTVVSILSIFITSSLTIDSMQGLALYLGAFLLYFVFVQFKDNEKELLNIVTYVMAANCVFYIILQGAFYNGGILEGRIDGNIGYANTYALLMVASLYFNKIRTRDNFKEIIDLIFIQGILLTGSRNTLLYLGIFIIANIFYEKKKNNVLSLELVFDCILSELIYLIIYKLRLGGILIITIILITYYNLINKKNRKIINIAALVMIPIGVIAAFSTKSNLLNRITSASLNSSELQLRFGYLEDVINYVFKNPLGGGLNTYMYNQGSFQSGFYDVRYVHNSFGQALYDMGYAGFIAFAMLFIIGGLVIIKGNNKNKFYYLLLFLTIYLHSLLDFDFAYMVTILIIVMIVAFAGNIDMNLSMKPKCVIIPLTIVSIYTFALTGIYYVGNSKLKNGKYEDVVHIAEYLQGITVKDNTFRILEFDGLIGLYNQVNDDGYLKEAINTLENGKNNINKKFYVYMKLAASYEEANDIDKACLYFEKNLDLQKYAVYAYNSYCDMLTRVEERNSVSYESKKAEIMNRYYTLQNNRSEKSIKRFQ